MAIRSWSTTAASNNSNPPNGWPEGMVPSAVNNTARQMMADLRESFETLPWFDFGHTPTRIDNDTITIPTDLTATYTAGRRIKLVGATTGYGTISSVSYSAPDTTINITMDSGNVPTSLSTVAVGQDASTGAVIAFYARTDAERSASVTPTYYTYPPGDIRRYGAVGDDTTICTTAFTSAKAQQQYSNGADVFVPVGTFKINGNIECIRGLRIRGCSREWSIIHVSGAITGFSLTEALSEPTRGSVHISNLTIKGDNTTVALVALTSAGLSIFENVRFWRGIKLVTLATECHSVTFRDCYFAGWKDYAVDCSGLNSVLRYENCRWNIVVAVDGSTVTAATSAAVRMDESTDVKFSGGEVNGDSELAFFLRVIGNTSRLVVENLYVEGITGPGIISGSSALIAGMDVRSSLISTTDSTAIDLTGGSLQHTAVRIFNVRKPESGVGHLVFNPGSATDYEYIGVPLDGSCGHVANFTSNRRVRRFEGRYLLDARVRQLIGPFTANNVAANQSSIAMTGTRWVAVRDGSVTGVVVKSNEGRTVGTLTAETRKNTGLAGASGTQLTPTAVLDGTNTSKDTGTQSPGIDTYDAGDEIFPTVTTSADWAPTSADITVYIEVES